MLYRKYKLWTLYSTNIIEEKTEINMDDHLSEIEWY